MHTFGDRLRTLMALRGLTPARLAKALDVSAPIVRRWMAEPTCAMHAQHLVDLAQLLDVRASWLCTGRGAIGKHLPNAYTDTELLRLFQNLGNTDRIFLTDVATLFARRAAEK